MPEETEPMPPEDMEYRMLVAALIMGNLAAGWAVSRPSDETFARVADNAVRFTDALMARLKE